MHASTCCRSESVNLPMTRNASRWSTVSKCSPLTVELWSNPVIRPSGVVTSTKSCDGSFAARVFVVVTCLTGKLLAEGGMNLAKANLVNQGDDLHLDKIYRKQRPPEEIESKQALDAVSRLQRVTHHGKSQPMLRGRKTGSGVRGPHALIPETRRPPSQAFFARDRTRPWPPTVSTASSRHEMRPGRDRWRPIARGFSVVFRRQPTRLSRPDRVEGRRSGLRGTP